MAKTLFVRYDRLGDFLLTLPSETAWLKSFPNDEIFWLVSPQVSFLSKSLPPPQDRFLFVSAPQGYLGKLKGAWNLSRQLSKQNFSIAFIFLAPWWIALALAMSRIPERVGVASKIWAWMFYSRPVRQRRSQAIKHEAEYNLDLLKVGRPSEITTELIPTSLQVSHNDLRQAQSLLQSAGVSGDYVVIHAGMGGSALNWPPHYYFQLAEKLLEKNQQVVVTGTRGDREFVAQTGLENLSGIHSLLEKTEGTSILGVLKLSKAVVCPSTGVAHLAAAVGAKVFGIYSHIKVEAPQRWGPLGKNVKVFSPSVVKTGCEGNSCKQFDCMAQITVDEVVQAILERK